MFCWSRRWSARLLTRVAKGRGVSLLCSVGEEKKEKEKEESESHKGCGRCQGSHETALVLLTMGTPLHCHLGNVIFFDIIDALFTPHRSLSIVLPPILFQSVRDVSAVGLIDAEAGAGIQEGGGGLER